MMQSNREIESIILLMGVFLSINLIVSAFMNWYRRSRRIGGTMSDAVAGQRLPTQGRSAAPRAVDWVRRNLFSSIFNSILTIVVLVLAGLVVPPLFRWAVMHATISGMTRAACT